MRLRVLGCYGGQLLGFHLTSFLVNDTVLLDAGSPTEALNLEEQHRIRHVFISHTHLDHIKDIAFLADNRSLKRLGGEQANRTITIHSLSENIETLKRDFLNDRIWPDFTRIPSEDDPILVLSPLEPEKPVEADGLVITPVEVNHPVPCTGFIVDDGEAQLVYTADTGRTDRIWELANELPNLRAVIVDCSFPNAYARLAEISGHLTPAQMHEEVTKLDLLGEIPVYLYHMKPETLAQMTAEVEALNIPHLRMLSQVDELLF